MASALNGQVPDPNSCAGYCVHSQVVQKLKKFKNRQTVGPALPETLSPLLSGERADASVQEGSKRRLSAADRPSDSPISF